MGFHIARGSVRRAQSAPLSVDAFSSCVLHDVPQNDVVFDAWLQMDYHAFASNALLWATAQPGSRQYRQGWQLPMIPVPGMHMLSGPWNYELMARGASEWSVLRSGIMVGAEPPADLRMFLR